MNISHQLFERCKSYLLAQSHPKYETKKVPARAVTISRETGAGGVTIGRLLADHLESCTGAMRGSWAVLDRNLVERVLQDHGLEQQLAEYMSEDSVSSIRDAFEEILGLHPSSWTLQHHIQFTILKLATIGNAVIVGRGGNIITRELKHVLHVRLVAPFEQRVKHTAIFYQLTEKDAARFVRRTERARAGYMREHFQTSVADPLQYHLVLNTGSLSFDKAARIIADAVLELDGQEVSQYKVERNLTAETP